MEPTPLIARTGRRAMSVELGVDERTLQALERQGAIRSSGRSECGLGRPAIFDHVDAAIASVAVGAYRIGINGRRLRALAEQLHQRRSTLEQGWSGVVIFDGEHLDLVPTPGPLTIAIDRARVVIPMQIAMSYR